MASSYEEEGEESDTSRSSSSGRISARVDRLLAHTRSLMGDVTARHNVAFSGGVDSSLVAALLRQCRSDSEQVRAILGLSPAVPKEQLETARAIADHIGIPLSIIRTNEGQDETYLANEGQACLACKTHLYSSMRAVVDHLTDEIWSSTQGGRDTLQLYNGTNADDVKDPTRLGLIVAQKFEVLSPLQHITKDEVREISKHLGLPNWNYAASPCLRSRLALGVPATAGHLHRIEEAERFVRDQLRPILDQTSNLRVRLLSENRARIELDAEHVDYAETIDWENKFVTELGFSSVSIKPFRSGSVATRKAREHSHSDDIPQQVVVSLHA
ncbi:hypothetical protein ACA910_016090 [Epithemia clementina (nom. ined.)]